MTPMTSMTSDAVEDYHWLTGPEAESLLAELVADKVPLHRASQRLRRLLSENRTRLVLELAELRPRAQAKFSSAQRMFFTRKSLEQATDFWVADYKASRLAKRGPVADLCCGIGGDLLALASHTQAVGLDRDPSMVVLAEANLRACGLSAQVQRAEAQQVEVEAYAAWHVDPDRRPEERRTSRVAAGEPSAEALKQLLVRNNAAAIKLAPAAETPSDWQQRSEREWISRDRQCRQQVAWFGNTAEALGQCRATIVYRDGRVPQSIMGKPDQPLSLATRVGRFVFEPDPAVLAAGLCGHLAAVCQLQPVASGVAYLTTDEARDHPLLAQFEVLDVLPLDMKRLRAIVHERRIGRLEVKKRGLPHDPAEVLRHLRPEGDESATLLLTPTRQGARAILARRTRSGTPAGQSPSRSA